VLPFPRQPPHCRLQPLWPRPDVPSLRQPLRPRRKPPLHPRHGAAARLRAASTSAPPALVARPRRPPIRRISRRAAAVRRPARSATAYRRRLALQGGRLAWRLPLHRLQAVLQQLRRLVLPFPRQPPHCRLQPLWPRPDVPSLRQPLRPRRKPDANSAGPALLAGGGGRPCHPSLRAGLRVCRRRCRRCRRRCRRCRRRPAVVPVSAVQ